MKKIHSYVIIIRNNRTLTNEPKGCETMVKIFVDGQEGTTGLKIHERLSQRSDIELLTIDPEKRKDLTERKKFINAADIVYLCLPDDAARESVSLVDNDHTKLIDASTAHRTHPDWAYGLPELSTEHRQRIQKASRVSVPGCYATGFAAIVYPLVQEGILPADYPVSCHAVSGYSGGGKKLIAKYQAVPHNGERLRCPRYYALGLKHKHVPEMHCRSGLSYPPIFNPILGDYHQGMAVSVPLFPRLLAKGMTAKDLQGFFSSYYADQHFIQVIPFESDAFLDEGYFDPTGCNGTNRLEIFVFGYDDQILVTSRLDNLGKGASGAAMQCMNIMLGIDEGTGLE